MSDEMSSGEAAWARTYCERRFGRVLVSTERVEGAADEGSDVLRRARKVWVAGLSSAPSAGTLACCEWAGMATAHATTAPASPCTQSWRSTGDCAGAARRAPRGACKTGVCDESDVSGRAEKGPALTPARDRGLP